MQIRPGAAPAPSGPLEIRGSATGLLDEPILLRVRGAGPAAELTWRARYRDDDDRVWRAAAAGSEDLAARWVPAKESTGALAALRSLRPLSIEVRAETADGRAAARTLTRVMVADGVRVRRWRDGLAATLHVPARPQPCATVIVDATAGPAAADVAALAAPLLASRGALVLVVGPSRGVADPLALARERLGAVPAARGPILLLPVVDPFAPEPAAGVVLPPGIGGPAAGVALSPRDGGPAAAGVVLPPGVGARDGGPQVAAARAVAWDALLDRLGATPREQPAPGGAPRT
jgi:hypothetical protein